MKKIEIIKPDDFHVHLRQGEMLQLTVPHCASSFSRALIMPNTVPPVASAEAIDSYREDISKIDGRLTPLMTFKLLKSHNPDDIRSMSKAGVLAGKLYPAGATTNSEDGIVDWKDIMPLLKTMDEEGLVLSIHGEDPSVFSLEREKAFIPRILEICQMFPDLRVVFEHLSSAEGIEAVERGPSNLAGTITVHHLLYTLDDVLGGSLNPHYFCKPVLKSPADRDEIQKVVLEGNRKFFFGSDSAPHPVASKESGSGSAGSYTTPVALPLLAEFFEEKGRLDLLEGFVSLYGADFYGLPVNRDKITLVRESWSVPSLYNGVKPIHADREIQWKIEE